MSPCRDGSWRVTISEEVEDTREEGGIGGDTLMDSSKPAQREREGGREGGGERFKKKKEQNGLSYKGMGWGECSMVE